MTTGQIGTLSPANSGETADPKPIRNGLGEWFMRDYVPRHCAANGLDPAPFLDPDHEPPPAICPHCGAELRYRIRECDPVTGDFWAWRPFPEECENPRCQELNQRERNERALRKHTAEFWEQVDQSGIPPEYRRANLSEYRPEHPTQEHAAQIVRDYRDAITEGPLDGRGIYLCGPVGTGKTHLAVTIAKAALWHGHWTRFVASDELLEIVRRGGRDEDAMAPYRSAPMLVIDDIGKEYSTPWAVKQLERLINARMCAGRPTIYTSNYALRGGGKTNDLFTAMAKQNDGDADCAAAIVSRIGGTADIVIVNGDDYRLRKFREARA